MVKSWHKKEGQTKEKKKKNNSIYICNELFSYDKFLSFCDDNIV